MLYGGCLVYRLVPSQDFERWLAHHKHDRAELERVEHEIMHVVQDPHTGKPLGFPGFHEKNFGPKRILYVIFDDLGAVFVVDVTDKKHQEEEIGMVRASMGEFRGVVLAALRQEES
ncbi:MAG: hypothetical protein HC945_00695 [Nitrosarchaeum sp.]|nr:hypothetical protein [Nitrosarchaeum sp.]